MKALASFFSQNLRALCLLLIKGYQGIVSPWLSPRCRFLPTCSAYAAEAIQTYGLVKGGGLALKRFCRCNPWGGHGYDPLSPASVSCQLYCEDQKDKDID